ncbi:MAG: protein-(glutamine-N5) methyltransferase, release factor-specific [Draconibacterium sp.]|nr:MAG: protein-(glutamine-N5) methyltransferase, release factor-specific [Draconibacterium sp.]
MQTTIQYIHAELSGIYPTEEIMGITKILLEHVTGWNYTQQVINAHKSLLDRDKEQINSIVKRLKEYEPVQYILGKTEFYGLKIRVSPAVLIPRPETEELVALVLQKNIMEKPKILDLGTGSGCIALALKSRLKNATVTGVDISGDALEIARENAKLNGLDVCFLKGNMLKWRELSRGKYDIIVSNPPYVTEKEKTAMEPNVLNYEPSDALFVPDDDPLVFYRAVASD